MTPDSDNINSLNLQQNYKLSTTAPSSFSFTGFPQPVGAWVLYPGAGPTTKFMMYRKPTDEQVKATEELLGWGWEDA